MSKVKITANPKTGKVFTQSLNEDGSPKLDKNGKEYGTIRVENPAEVSLDFAYQGNNIKRGQSALISMEKEAFEKNQAHYGAGVEVKGRVRTIETTETGLPGFKAKMAGNGEDALPCLLGGAQIYRKTEFDGTGRLEDMLIAHDNSAEISAAAKAKASAPALNA